MPTRQPCARQTRNRTRRRNSGKHWIGAVTPGAQAVEYVRRSVPIVRVHREVKVTSERVGQFRPGMEYAIANGMVVEQPKKLANEAGLCALAPACQAGRVESLRYCVRVFCGVSHELQRRSSKMTVAWPGVIPARRGKVLPLLVDGGS